MKQKEGLEWLEKELQGIGEHFNQTELYKLLKKYLTAVGHWKGRPRGKPTISNLTPKMKKKVNGLGNSSSGDIHYEPFDL